MKKFEEMTHDEKKEVAALFENWLGCYTDEVINRVMTKRDEILANEFTMNLLKELKQRGDKEKKNTVTSFMFLLEDYENYKQYSVHNHCTTHASSYRDVLYDMYIASK